MRNYISIYDIRERDDNIQNCPHDILVTVLDSNLKYTYDLLRHDMRLSGIIINYGIIRMFENKSIIKAKFSDGASASVFKMLVS